MNDMLRNVSHLMCENLLSDVEHINLIAHLYFLNMLYG